MVSKDRDIFSISVWYPDFKHLTFESKIVPVSLDFLKYLSQDGITIPPGLDGVSASFGEDNQSDDEDEWASAEEDEEDQKCYEWVPDFRSAIEAALDEFGGQVIPKMNWSAPKDAAWILPNRQCKCTSASDVLLLLKASTFVAYDVAKLLGPAGVSVTPELALRKWSEVNPGCEFRCFVKKNTLIGISQRYCTTFYPHIAEDAHSLRNQIQQFFVRNIHGKFPAVDFVFDVVVENPSASGVVLVDFNPFHRVTDAILFSWDELLAVDTVPDHDLLRFVNSHLSIQPDEMRQYQIPSDISDRRFTTNGQDLFGYLDTEIARQKENGHQ